LGNPDVEGEVKTSNYVLKRTMRRIQEKHWRIEVGNSNSLKAYPKDTLFGRSQYVGRGAICSTVAKYRLGSLENPWEKRMACIAYVREGILAFVRTLCPEMPNPCRDWCGIVDSEESSIGNLGEILKNDSWNNMREIFLRNKLYNSRIQ
jgi:hypothetical protein